MQVPLTSCNKAADALIEWFGPKDLKHVVGGERWWQVRGLDGIDAEWITEKKFIQDAKISHPGKLSDEEKNILRMESLETVMVRLYASLKVQLNAHPFMELSCMFTEVMIAL